MSDSLDNFMKISHDIKTSLDIPIKPLSPMLDVDLAQYQPREEDTFVYQMQQQTNQIIEKSNEQIKLLNDQNKQLVSNYDKLEDLYKLKEKELEESKQEAEKAKKYNTKMLVIALISAGIALASLVDTILIAVL